MLWPAFPGLIRLGPQAARGLATQAGMIGVDPVDLAVVVQWETAGSWDPRTAAPSSSATGLLQWLGSTAKLLGMVSSVSTARAEIQAMTAGQQIGWFYQTIVPALAALPTPRSLTNLYLAVFSPSGVGQPPETTIWASGSAEADANPGLQDADGAITVDSVSRSIARQRAFADALPRWDDAPDKRRRGFSGTLFVLAIAAIAAIASRART